MAVERLDRRVDVEDPGLGQQRLHAKRQMTAQPSRAFRLTDRLEGPPDRVLADNLLHPQEFRQHRVAAQRRDMRVALVAGEHGQHRRAENVPLPGRVRAQIAQRTVGDQGVEQPARLEKVDEERKLAKRRHRRFMVPFDPVGPRNCRDRPLPVAPSPQPWVVHHTGEPKEVTNRASCP